MKAFFTVALSAAVASAQTFVTTNNECWLGQGGEYQEECKDVYFFTCDVYTVEPSAACNVYTFSDSRVTWFSQDLIAHYWEYYRRTSVDKDASIDGYEDMTEEGKCYAVSDVPTQYTNGLVMNYTKGMCGFKYQITNNNEEYPNEFQVLKDSAATLLASSAVAIAAVLAF